MKPLKPSAAKPKKKVRKKRNLSKTPKAFRSEVYRAVSKHLANTYKD